MVTWELTEPRVVHPERHQRHVEYLVIGVLPDGRRIGVTAELRTDIPTQAKPEAAHPGLPMGWDGGIRLHTPFAWGALPEVQRDGSTLNLFLRGGGAPTYRHPALPPERFYTSVVTYRVPYAPEEAERLGVSHMLIRAAHATVERALTLEIRRVSQCTCCAGTGLLIDRTSSPTEPACPSP
jgi:hypothetical protein